MQTRMTSIGKRIPLIASIAFQAFSVKALSIDEQAALPPMRQNHFERNHQEKTITAQNQTIDELH
jgi:hypothetical protein